MHTVARVPCAEGQARCAGKPQRADRFVESSHAEINEKVSCLAVTTMGKRKSDDARPRNKRGKMRG